MEAVFKYTIYELKIPVITSYKISHYLLQQIEDKEVFPAVPTLCASHRDTFTLLDQGPRCTQYRDTWKIEHRMLQATSKLSNHWPGSVSWYETGYASPATSGALGEDIFCKNEERNVLRKERKDKPASALTY